MFWCFLLIADMFSLVYTEFILVRLWRKLLAYINTLESIPGTNQYRAVLSVLLKKTTACPWQGLNQYGLRSLDY